MVSTWDSYWYPSVHAKYFWRRLRFRGHKYHVSFRRGPPNETPFADQPALESQLTLLVSTQK